MRVQKTANAAHTTVSKVWRRFASIFHPQTPLAERFSRFCFFITGTDADLIAQCPANERTWVRMQAVVMVFIALLTASGLAPMLAAQRGITGVATILVWAGVFILVLSLESLIISSMTSGKALKGAVLARLPLACLFVALQAVPWALVQQRDRIALQLAENSLSKQASLVDRSSKVLGVEALQASSEEIKKQLERARADQANPPRHETVVRAQADLVAAEANVKQAQSGLSAAAERYRRQQAIWAEAKSPDARERAATAVKAAHELREKAQTTLRTANAQLEGARNALQQAQITQQTALDAAVTAVEKAQQAHTARVTSTQEQLDEAKAKAKRLADAANAANFSAELGALFELMRNDWKVLGVVCFMIVAAIIFDMVPSVMRARFVTNSTYSRLDQHQRAQMHRALEQAESEAAAADEATRELRAQQTLLTKNQTAGIEAFCREDNGAIDAQLAHAQRQQALDEAMAASTIAVNTAVIEALGEQLRKIQANLAFAEAHPETAEALRTQMDQLMDRLNSEVKAMRNNTPLANAGDAPSGQV